MTFLLKSIIFRGGKKKEATVNQQKGQCIYIFKCIYIYIYIFFFFSPGFKIENFQRMSDNNQIAFVSRYKIYLVAATVHVFPEFA